MTVKTIEVGSDMLYTGTTHAFMTGQPVRVVAVYERGISDPDNCTIINKPGSVVYAGDGDMIEVAPYVGEGEGRRPTWAPSDATVDELEDYHAD